MVVRAAHDRPTFVDVCACRQPLVNEDLGGSPCTRLNVPRPAHIPGLMHVSGASHQGRDLYPSVLQCPRQGSLLAPSQSVTLTVTPTPFPGEGPALRYDAVHRLYFGMVV